MDTRETYIKMSQKATEVQEAWQQEPKLHRGDLVYIETFRYYKRSARKGLRGWVVKYHLCDTANDNPGWVESHHGIRGVEMVTHSFAEGSDSKMDGPFPPTVRLIELDRVRNPLLDDQYVPIEWCTWLPSQDRLQEMVRNEKHMHLLAYEFAIFFHGSLDPFYRQAGNSHGVDDDGSMEQMWLAFVMKEKYNKTWNGEDWA